MSPMHVAAALVARCAAVAWLTSSMSGCFVFCSVTGGVSCPAHETRMIATVSMARMTRVKWVDKENMVACVEAGAIGTPQPHTSVPLRSVLCVLTA